MDDHTRLEPTAALVMLWSRDLYQSGSAGTFYSLLDLSAGKDMKNDCDRACPWYGEVTLNRKFWIRRLAGAFIKKTGTPCQLVLPAAGKSPLALELLDDCGDAIASVIEIDIRGMAEKQRLYEKAAPDHAGKIRCVTADLLDLPGLAKAISSTRKYDPYMPTCVIPEGFSYYVMPRDFARMVSLFSSKKRTNQIIFDYLLPCSLVNQDRRKYPRGVWNVINRECLRHHTMTYSSGELEETLLDAGCTQVVHHAMHDIERERTGSNRYFPSVADGWIQVAEGRL